ncbi:beta-ketoacyl-ACP synthase III [Desulforamulus hydrothermalis]|uniref:Beta-ketoacyl-[acyl-carrier-protein] synthase III n=1 Tax=Desulforamulus hydrothermalis Lam5 = DSM 18033 TaxID=1121428 RepID=K8EIR4_9FIRM|nr:beta-ketoacyl-ACP synthase III [Desulforamulus hydrothermalis]CCO08501.1 3-oxoacyl-(acyl-carrier-protein) synthase 3 [Desulforamulus hydrothermalis Lam5 = DSM 18033]SHH29695.1 3-oxoacyl-[acyl-carrier-protein] synthase-3 [Desulforamulus hydrothermalis Lam5 = DSM 18033]
MPNHQIQAGILGVGSYVPERILTNKELEQMVDTSDEWITARTGIRERRILDPSQSTSDLAVLASRQALADAGVKPEELDLIILTTCSKDMLLPAGACLVQAELGAHRAGAFDLEAGCSGFVYGLAIAAQFIATGAMQRILVIGAEALSRIINWQDRNTCVLFGDGAGAVVVGPVAPGEGILASKLSAEGTGWEHLYIPAGGAKMPADPLTVEKNLHYVHMNGKEVFRFATRVMEEESLHLIKAANLQLTDIDLLIPHQANIRIIEHAAKKLKLPMDKVVINLDRFGNTSSASIPLALDEAVKSGRVQAGDNIVMVAFGAGLTSGGIVLKWSKGRESNET